MRIPDGGYAFPTPPTVADANDAAFKVGHHGMSQLDYFAAHAPDDPQEWFEPVMRKPPTPVERPDPFNDDLSKAERDLATEAFELWQAEYHAWREENRKERVLQWPYAWAREQLSRRDA